MMSQSQPTRNGTSQTQPILIIAITLFAFSGLMVGFTVGAFTHNRPSTANTNPTTVNTNHTTPTSPPTPTPSPTATEVVLGCPDFEAPTSNPNANGTLVYNATIQAKDKTGEDANKKCNIPLEKTITADGITCRIWLQDSDPNADLGSNTTLLQHPDTFNQPFPHERQGALIFDPSTSTETQPCVRGTAQWKFTISPSVPKGNYFLVGLTDWQGQHWNWASVLITVSNSSTPTATNNNKKG